ncbi:hypothetical protein [Kineococcus aurantiacus]|uniref:Uncharacterized protein n=1 Tax=Kineococcus aurantiacus TaxID=37633 RepID=A0A7Y9DPT4_9ACTN|nr:hypothetical protein [Kineococcus aurantiacus]NYD24582.1 hypothetical protein [Kineococcus aurantiacus]
MTATPGAVEVATREDRRWREAWTEALDALELDVRAAEELLEHLHDGSVEQLEDVPLPVAQDWVADTALGPMPGDFADRARRLLQRQLSLGERLAEAMVQVRAQRRVLGKMDRAEARPVFVDRSA